MTGRDQGDLHIVPSHRFAIGGGLAGDGEAFAIAFAHGGQGFRRRQHRPVPGPGVVGMAVGHHRAVHRPDRVDVEVAGRAIEALGAGTEQVLRSDHRLSRWCARRRVARLRNVHFITQYSYCEIELMTKT